MNKEALKARAAALQTELNALNAEIEKPELPEGFTPFEPTEHNAPPCHPQDEVLIFTKRGGSRTDAREAKRFRWNKESGYGSDWNIIGYKIVKKYVVPRPMQFSEIPTGVLFINGITGQIHIKTCENTAIVITGSSAGYSRNNCDYTDDDRFYAVKPSFVSDQELVVKNP